MWYVSVRFQYYFSRKQQRAERCRASKAFLSVLFIIIFIVPFLMVSCVLLLSFMLFPWLFHGVLMLFTSPRSNEPESLADPTAFR